MDLKIISAGPLPLKKQIFDPNDIFSLILKVFIPLSSAKNVSIILKTVNNLQMPNEGMELLDPINYLSHRFAVIPKMIGDSRRFQQVLVNLLKNALKFTGAGSITIKVSYNPSTSYMIVHVCDTGSGIKPEHIPKLFTRFGKLHRTSKMNSDGIGLGLTIVKQIVESAEGKIEIRSKGLDQGTTVFFSMKMTEFLDCQVDDNLDS